MSKYDHELDMASDNSTSLILNRIQPKSKVLEFGPASGYMTRYMKEELNCIITGIELDPQDAAAAEVYCHKMIVANLDDLTWPQQLEGEQFDHIIFADVLEHLRYSHQVLKQAVGFLREQGTILTSIPNIAHNAVVMDLLQGNFEYHKLGLLDDTHVRLFTRESILQLLDAAGLSPVEWLGTVAQPENTEFGQSYLNFPEAVQKYLAERSEGHVYQYITVSKKTANVLPEELCQQFEVGNAKPSLNFLQLYWEIEGNYAEENSAKQPVKGGSDWEEYHFQIPALAGGCLRFDPGNWSAYIDLHSIKVYADEATPRILASLAKENNFTGLILANEVFELENMEYYRFVCTTQDPYLFINLPVNHQAAKIVTIRLRVFDSAVHVADLLKLQQDRLKEQFTELQALRVNNQALTKQMRYIRIFMDAYHKLKNSARQLKKLLKQSRKLGRKCIGSIPGWYAAMKLIPYKNVKQLTMADCWRTTNDDPQFYLHGLFPVGWVRISFLSAAAKESLPLKLYWNDGTGINERNSLTLGTIQPGKPIVQHAVVFISRQAEKLRLDPGEQAAEFLLCDVRMLKVTRAFLAYRLLKKFFSMNGMSFSSVKLLWRKSAAIINAGGFKGLWAKIRNKSASNAAFENAIDYQTWVKQDELTEERKKRIRKEIERFPYKPLISVLVPVYNVDEIWLRKCLDSVRSQLYSNWELCIADDASPKPHIRTVLAEYCALDSRIKVIYREVNGHISASSNSCLEMAAGEFIALLDHDDELTADALYENVKLLNQDPEADMIYSDEDKISVDGQRHSPFFKPDWSPDMLLSQMYTCHLGIYRTQLVREIGGFRKGFEGSQDHDLVLRLTELTQHIQHIPRILYHWRSIPESTASGGAAKEYTTNVGLLAVADAIKRRAVDGWVEADAEIANLYCVHYRPTHQPLVSIIIPTRNMGDLLEKCLASIFAKTTYAQYEIIIVDNGSDEPETIAVFEKWLELEPKRFYVERMEMAFNFSRLNNLAVPIARGELILLLNNDIEVIAPDWLTEMAGQAIRPKIGAVGACLLYPDHTIQHAGIILGIGGIAGHSHKYYNADHPGYFSRLRMVANYSAVTAACLMVRKEVYQEVSGLDEILSVAFNDVDFCLKLIRMGYHNIWLPQVKLYHHESKSRGHENTPEKLQRFRQEVARMAERWGSLLQNDPYYNPNLTLKSEDYSLALRGQD